MIHSWLSKPATSGSHGGIIGNDRLWLIVAAVAWLAAVVAILPLGYGRDSDTYYMLRTWQYFVHAGKYVPSREPGFPFAEFSIGFAASLAGAWLSNLVMAVCAIASAVLAYLLALKLEVARPKLVAALFLANPWIMVQSATSMDYMLGFVCLLGGMVAVLHGRLLPGVVLLAIAVGTRMPLLFYAGAFLWLASRSRLVPDLRFGEAFVALFFISGLFYLPVWIASSLRFDWLTASWIDDQGLTARLARLAIKPPRLFGLLPSLAALGVLAMLWRRGVLGLPWRASFAARLSLAMVVITLAIYARLPTDISYMIFLIPFLGMLLIEMGAVPVLQVLAVGGLVTAVVDIDPIEILSRDGDECGWLVRSARLSPHFIAGPVLAEVQEYDRGEACYRKLLLVDYASANSPLP